MEKTKTVEYVCGFAFRGEEVLLIQKLKPEWQRGKWNGLGGKIEDRETPHNAMVREFMEECGLDTNPSYWHLFHREDFKSGATVYFFFTDLDTLDLAESKEAKVVHRWHRGDIRIGLLPMIYNIPYLVEMAYALSNVTLEHRPQNATNDEMRRLREVEHLAWHLLDDSEERVMENEIVVSKEQYEALSAVLPGRHP